MERQLFVVEERERLRDGSWTNWAPLVRHTDSGPRIAAGMYPEAAEGIARTFQHLPGVEYERRTVPYRPID
jgi:hypothetical protein